MSEQSNNQRFVSENSFKKDLCPAAVVVPVLQKPDGPHLILTKRSETVAHHKNQICFPGGRQEDQDESLWHTAIREAEEEIGLPQMDITLIEELSVLTTPTGFLVTPFVGLVERDFIFKPSFEEISEVIVAPVEHFLNRDHLQFEDRVLFGETIKTPVYVFENHRIWGATGRILFEFLSRFKSSEIKKIISI